MRRRRVRKNASTGRLKINLHDPAINPVGRIDILAARAIKLYVETSHDPVLSVAYKMAGPVVDSFIAAKLSPRSIERILGLSLIGE